jgi:hypothetical protein
MESLVARLAEMKGGGGLKREAVDMNEVVRSTVERLQVSRLSGIQVALDLEADGCVEGDRAMLQRVVENLVTNALDAMNGRGTLSLSTQTKRLLRDREARLVLTVSDTGAGMDEAFLKTRLFRPFSTTKPNGLGWGLCQCRGILRAHAGEMHVDSKVGVGTTFRVSLKSSPVPLRTSIPRVPRGLEAPVDAL